MEQLRVAVQAVADLEEWIEVYTKEGLREHPIILEAIALSNKLRPYAFEAHNKIPENIHECYTCACELVMFLRWVDGPSSVGLEGFGVAEDHTLPA